MDTLERLIVALDLPSVSAAAAMVEKLGPAVSFYKIGYQLGYAGGTNLTGDQVKKLDVWGHDIMTAALRKSGMCAALVSEEAPEPIEMSEGKGLHALVVACDPVDGSSNLDVNGTVGTIFSLRPSKGMDPAGPAALAARCIGGST